MKISAPLYFSFWAVISTTFLVLGFNALSAERLKILSPPFTYTFKLFLAISVCHSSSYALVHRPLPTMSVQKRFYLFFDGYRNLLLLWTCFGPPPLWVVLGHAFCVAFVLLHQLQAKGFAPSIDFFVRDVILITVGDDSRIFPAFVLLVAFVTVTATAMEYGPCVNNYLQVPGYRSTSTRSSNILETYKKRKTIRFAVAMLVSILFQNYVKFTTFAHVLAFLYFAGAWLGCTALMMSSEDLGVFDFMLSNLVVGCTMNNFGLRGPTWLAYGASVSLFGLRRALGTVEWAHERDEDLSTLNNHMRRLPV